jgi:hypothetical protein
MNKAAALLLSACFAMGCSAKTARFVSISRAPARFAAEIPSDWTAIENPAGGAPGVQFLSPPSESKSAVRAYISVDFYPAGDPHCASLDLCLAERTRELPGRRYGPVADIRVGSLPGKEFTIMKPLPQSLESSSKGEQSVRTILLPAENGLYEICLAAPEDDAAAPAAAFERFLGTFRPTAL